MALFTNLSAQRKKILYVAAAFVFYLVAFYPLYTIANGAAFLLAVLPVSVGAFAFGLRGGLSAFLIVMLANIVRGGAVGYEWSEIFTLGEFWFNNALLLAVGIGASQFNWLRNRADTESVQRQSIELIYQTLVEHSLQGLSIYQNGTFLFVNEPFAEMAGIPLQRFQNSTLQDLGHIIHEDDRAMVFEYALTRQLPGKLPPQHYEFRVVHPDGSIRWLETYQHLITYDGAVAAQGFYIDITEQKQAELSLAEERHLLRTLIDTIPYHTYVKDTQHRFVIANKGVAEGMHVTSDQLIGKMDADFYPQDVAAKFAADEIEVMQTGQAKLNYEEPYINPIGEPRWVLTSKAPLYNNAGDIIGLVGIGLDITETKVLEQQLVESEQHYRELIEALPIGVLVLSRNDPTLINDAGLKILGLDEPDDLQQTHLFDMTHAGDLDRVAAIIQDTNNANKPIQYTQRLTRRDGTVLTIEVGSTPLVKQDDQVTLVVFRDITEQLKQEKARHKIEARHRSLFALSKDAILITTVDGNILDANKAALDMYGIATVQALKDTDFINTYPHQQYRDDYYQQLKEHGYATAMTGGYQFSDKVYAISSVIVPGDESEDPYIITNVRDETARVKAEQALRESVANLDAIFTNTHTGIVYSNQDGIIVDCNPAFAALNQHSYADIVGKSVASLTHPDDRARDRVFLQQTQSGLLDGYDDTKRYLRPDGSIVWVEVSVTCLHDEDGNLQNFVGIVQDITERRQAELALQESETRFRHTVESSLLGYVFLDRQGYIQQVNDALVKMFKYDSPDELIGKHYLPFVHRPEDSDAANTPELVETQVLRGDEFIRICKDGSLGYQQFSGIPMVVNNKTIGVEGFVIDTTERHQAEQALADNENQMRSILQVVPTGIGVVNQRVFYQVNEQVCEMTGYTAEELIGQSVKMIYPSDEVYQHVGYVIYDDVAQQGVGNLESQWQRKDGTVIDVLISVVPINPDDLSMGMTFTVLDITARKQAELALQKSQERLSLAFQGANDGLWDWTINTNKVYYSPRWKGMLGFEDDEIENDFAEWERLVHPDDLPDAWAILSQFLESKADKVELEFRMKHKAGHWVDILSRAFVPYRDDAGDALRLVGTHVDITSRKRREDQIQAALDEKVVLLQEVHHRVKNNLQVIASLLSLQARTVQDPVVLQALKGSRERVYSMALVHEQLYQSSDLARIDFAEYAHSLINNLVRSYARQREHVTLDLNIDEIPLDINLAIPCGLITNELISNALIYAFPDERQGTLTVNFSQQKDQYILQIMDDGVGLPENIDPAHSPSLGLNLVQNLVLQIKGQMVWEIENGTSYTITFGPQLRKASHSR